MYKYLNLYLEGTLTLLGFDVILALFQATNLDGNLAYHADTYRSWLMFASKRISLDAGYSIMSSVKLNFI